MKGNKESVISNKDFTNIYNKHAEEIKNLNIKKMERNFEKTVTDIDEINYLRRIYTNSILRMTEIDCSSISTENCEMCCMFIGDNIYSGAYGQIKGCFRYKDNRLFVFDWNIHQPNQPAKLANRMTNIKEFVKKYDARFNLEYFSFEDTLFGIEAFWLNTPDDSLTTNEDKDLRKLMKSLKSFSVKEELCKKIRKMDKKYLQFKERIQDGRVQK